MCACLTRYKRSIDKESRTKNESRPRIHFHPRLYTTTESSFTKVTSGLEISSAEVILVHSALWPWNVYGKRRHWICTFACTIRVRRALRQEDLLDDHPYFHTLFRAHSISRRTPHF